jgi:hypothetical protein
MGRSHRSAMTLPAGVCVFAYGLSIGLSIIIGGGGFVVGYAIGSGTLVIVNILVNGIVLVNRIGGGQFVGIIIGGLGWSGIKFSFHFIEPVTLPFTTVHSSLNVPSPVTGACSLVMLYAVILLVVTVVFEWNSIALRPSK